MAQNLLEQAVRNGLDLAHQPGASLDFEIGSGLADFQLGIEDAMETASGAAWVWPKVCHSEILLGRRLITM